MEAKEVIIKLLEARNKTRRELAKEMGVAEQSLSKMLSGTITLTDRSLVKISKVLSVPFDTLKEGKDLDRYLDKGIGAESDELGNTNRSGPNTKPKSITLYEVAQEGIPFYNVDVFAGNVESFNDGPEVPDSYLILPGVRDCQFSCRVSGDSMYNKIKPGAIIACREIFDKSIIAFGEVHLVITPEQKLVKYVRKHPTDPTKVILRSHNPEHDDIEVPIDKIVRLYLVKVIVNQEQM